MLVRCTRKDTEAGQTVTGFLPKDDGLQQALTGADIVVIPAGIPRTYIIRKF